jgi:hypothetical protein
MPASSGLRSRPQIGLMRSRSTHRAHIGGVLQLLPKSLILPIVIAAGIAAGVATFWTYGIHTDDAYAEADAPVVTGTVTRAN